MTTKFDDFSFSFDIRDKVSGMSMYRESVLYRESDHYGKICFKYFSFLSNCNNCIIIVLDKKATNHLQDMIRYIFDL